MLNIQNVGRKISELRRAQNMTQMELADRMNISFQAVSNWERGNSMPDIVKLPELAQLFNITIDELLGEKSALLNSVVQNNVHAYLKDNAVSMDEFGQIAPVLKPVQIDTIFENTRPPFDLAEITEILPFISRSTVNGLLQKAAEQENHDALEELLPFADSPVIDGIAKSMFAKKQSIEDLAPFMSEEYICELAVSGYEERGLSALEELMPFIPASALKTVADMEFDRHGLKDFEELAPFLDADYLGELAKKALQKHGVQAIVPIAPFLNNAALSEFIKEMFL